VARVVLLSGTDRGHTYPTVAVALALRERGHEVLVVTGRRRGPELDAAGVPWEPIPAAEPHDEHVDLSANLWSWATAAARPTAALLRRVGADAVVGDVLMATGGLAAELCDLPWLQLVPHHLTDAAVELPPMGLGRHPSRRPWVRADDRLIHRQARRSRNAGRADRAAARTALGLPPGAGRPAARLVASLPGLEYPRRVWPPDAHLVGPLAWDPPDVAVAQPFDRPAEDALAGVDPAGAPIVVVTDSTGTGASGGLAHLAVEALTHLDLQLVALTTDREAALRAERIWPLGCVVASIPHHRALDLAAAAPGAVVIAPGGAGVVGKTLRRGLPMTLVPDFGDQLEAAARVTWAGAGRRVDLRAPWTPWLPDPIGRAGQLRRAVVRVLADDRYAAAAGRLAEEAAQLGPPRAAEVVEQVIAGTLPPAEGPTRT
jgi:UDP:flavonoid glycosyltransferase YjiC (YdhE family)